MKKFIVILAVAVMSCALLAVSFSANAEEKQYKVLFWCCETEYVGYAEEVGTFYSEMDDVTVVTKTSGALTADELSGIQLVYIVNFTSSTDTTEGQNLINAAPLLKDFAIRGGRVVLNGENSGFCPQGNAVLSELAEQMGGNFTITNTSSDDTTMILNTEQKKELVEKLTEQFRPDYFAAIQSTNSNAIWVAKDSEGNVFVLDQKVQNGYITVLSDINWIYDGYAQPGVKEQACQFLRNLLLSSAQNMDNIENETKEPDYTITLENQNGEGSKKVVVKEGATLPKIDVPTREGYTFGGYYSEADGKGVKYYNADGTGAIAYSANGNIKLYALWIADAVDEPEESKAEEPKAEEKKPTSPDTGDNVLFGWEISLMGLALCAFLIKCVVSKKNGAFER